MDICDIDIREFFLNHSIVYKIGGGFSIEYIADQLAFITFRTAQRYGIPFVYDLQMIGADFAFQLCNFLFQCRIADIQLLTQLVHVQVGIRFKRQQCIQYVLDTVLRGLRCCAVVMLHVLQNMDVV